MQRNQWLHLGLHSEVILSINDYYLKDITFEAYRRGDSRVSVQRLVSLIDYFLLRKIRNITTLAERINNEPIMWPYCLMS